MNDSFGLAAFRSRTQVLRMEDALHRAGLSAGVIATPREVAIGCGLSVRFDLAQTPQVMQVYRRLNPGALIGFYLLGISLASIGLFLSAQTDSQATAAGMSFAATLLLFFLSTLAKLVSNSSSATLAAAAILLLLPAGALYAMTKSWRACACCAAVLETANAVCYFLLPERFSGGFPALMRRLSVFDRYY